MLQMKGRCPLVILAAGLLTFCMASVATADYVVTFDEPGIVAGTTTDPGFTLDPLTFAGVGAGTLRFSAGDPQTLDDTFVVDSSAQSGFGNSLASGFVDPDDIIFLETFGKPILSISALFNIDSNLDSALLLEGYGPGGGSPVATARVEEAHTDPLWSNAIALSSGIGMTMFAFRTEGAFLPFNIDNVRISVVPEPATGLLLFSALACMAARTRRRK